MLGVARRNGSAAAVVEQGAADRDAARIAAERARQDVGNAGDVQFSLKIGFAVRGNLDAGGVEQRARRRDEDDDAESMLIGGLRAPGHQHDPFGHQPLHIFKMRPDGRGLLFRQAVAVGRNRSGVRFAGECRELVQGRLEDVGVVV